MTPPAPYARLSHRTHISTIPSLVLLSLWLALPSDSMAQERVKGAHEDLEPGSQTDDLGIFVPIPASHPGRRYPADQEFPTGPAVGERLPDFSLPNQNGEMIDFHEDRGDSRAIVVFFRSAVW